MLSSPWCFGSNLNERQLILFGVSASAANETNQTASGTGVAGNRNQYVNSGAIGVGQAGRYLEAGSQDLTKSSNANAQPFANSKINVAKGGTLTITQQASAPVFGGSGSNSTQPIASLGTTSSTPSAPATGANNSAPIPGSSGDGSTPGTSTPPATVSGNWWDNIPGADQGVAWWGGLSLYQQIAAAAAAILVVIFIFHHRKSS